MSKCILLCGLPASGKSTYADKHFPMGNIMSTDIVIENIARSYGMTYDAAFKNLISFAENVMWKHIDWSIEVGNDIIIDRTNLSAKSRKKFIDKLKPYGYTFEAIVFPTPEKEEWERRLNSREGKTIPQNVLDSMVQNYEQPTIAEGFTKVSMSYLKD